MYRFPRLQANTVLRLFHLSRQRKKLCACIARDEEELPDTKYNSIVESYSGAYQGVRGVNEVRRRRRWWTNISKRACYRITTT